MNLHDIDKIINIICNIEKCEVDVIRSKKRNAELVNCRGIICLVLREVFDMKYRQIGKVINRSKSNTYKLYKIFETKCVSDKLLRKNYLIIIKKLKNEGLY